MAKLPIALSIKVLDTSSMQLTEAQLEELHTQELLDDELWFDAENLDDVFDIDLSGLEDK